MTIGLQLAILNSSDQHVMISLNFGGKHWFIFVVYVKCSDIERCSHIDRRSLRSSLINDMPQNEPWVCIGDFNTIRGDGE